MCWRQLAPDTRHKSSFGLRRQAFASPTQTYAKEVKTHVAQLKVDVFFGDVHAMFQSSFGPALEPQIFSSERSPAQSCSCEPQGHQNLGLGAPLQTHSELSHKPSRVLAQVASRTLNQRARVTNNVPWTQKLHARAQTLARCGKRKSVAYPSSMKLCRAGSKKRIAGQGFKELGGHRLNYEPFLAQWPN